MVNSCNGVFSLDDASVREISDTAEFAVSCYSEIHGDYNGMMKLVIRDPWQTREINIPLHVKAMGSFFGFQKHTLGYTRRIDGDFVSFGDGLKRNTNPIVRRVALENFSSEAIAVDWSLANFVKGRQYATLDLEVGDHGKVAVNVSETEEADVQSPFKLLTNRTVVEAHGKTVVIIEFVPSELGEFAGCAAARSGEFTHVVGLRAVVTVDSEADRVTVGSDDETERPE
jgi:hypothetical protein